MMRLEEHTTSWREEYAATFLQQEEKRMTFPKCNGVILFLKCNGIIAE